MYRLNEFCNILTALRKQKGWTQTYLAEQIGISPQAVSKWENGIGYPDVTLFPVLAQMFNVPIAVLFGERNEFSVKGIGVKAYTLNFPVPQKLRIDMGNICQVEIIQGTEEECRLVVNGDPIFMEYFSAEAEDDLLVIRIKNPSGSEIHWQPYDRCGYEKDNCVQIYTGIISEEDLDILVVNYLDLCCTDRINHRGNLEYVCTKEHDG